MPAFLQTAPLAFFVFAAGLIGLCVGSFLNVVIFRLPKILEREWKTDCQEYFKELFKPEALAKIDEPRFSLSFPRSFCPNCGHKITALENIPVLSFLFLKAQCKSCHQKISWRYPFIELLTGLLSALAIFTLGVTLQGFAAVVLIWFLIALTFIDFDHQLLPDSLTLPLLWLGLLINLCPHGFVGIREAVIGAMAGYLSLWSVFWMFKILTKKEGMGYGDFKLLAALGAWFGWKMLLPIVLFSSFVGALVGIVLIVATKHGKNVPIPFGPYLAGGGLLALFFGNNFLAFFFPTLF